MYLWFCFIWLVFKQLLNFFSNEYIGCLRNSPSYNTLVVEDPEVARHYLVFQHGPGGDVYPVPMVSDDDHSAPETHWQLKICFLEKIENWNICPTSFAKSDVAWDCEMVQLQHVRNGAESDEKILHLLELLSSQLDKRCGGEHSLWRSLSESWMLSW